MTDIHPIPFVATFGDPNSDPKAIAGTSTSPDLPAVQGSHFRIAARGFLAGIDPVFHQQAGAYGEGPHQGVMGLATLDTGTGVYGGGAGVPGGVGAGCIGVRGETFTGVGVQGQSFGAGLAGKFVGNVEVTGSLNVDHDIRLTGDLFLSNTGKDLAEQFEVDATAKCEPGMLMAIGENGALVPCASAYDKRVIGVISGAGALKPALTLGQLDSRAPTVTIALVGTVFCRVDADKASINVGDLLTSSDTPGHAMKAHDPLRSFGAVIGKALAALRRGQGLLPIVIALQ
jgi:hypothetical protein